MMFVRSVVTFALACFVPITSAAWELEEARPGISTWGYRPLEGSAGVVNPPAFTWAPEKDATAYTLEIARDATFEDIAYAVEATPWNAHAPSETLAAGPYYWRYKAQNSAGDWSNWSVVRTFSVPEETRPFPQPSLDELLQRMPGEHPRLFFRPEDLPRLRELGEGALADRWAALVKAGERIIASPPDTSEPPLYPEGTVHKGEEWRKIWWGNRLRAIAVADSAASLGFLYQVSGEEKYAAAGRDLLLALTTWDPDGSTQYRYNDEAAMPLLYFPARAYTWLRDYLTPEERAKVVAMMTRRGEQCFDRLRGHLWQPYESHSNRAWHFLGEVAIAFHGDIEAAPQWLDFAMTIFYTCYPVWGGENGGWHEGTAYWSSYLERFLYWVYAAKSAFDIDAFQKPYFDQAGYFTMYIAPPGAQTAGFADQGFHSNSSRGAQLMRVLAAASGNGHWQWYAEAHDTAPAEGYMGFLYEAQGRPVEAMAPRDIPLDRAFHEVGIAALNTTLIDAAENTAVLFKSSPMGSQSHGYNANNSFLLTMGGKPVFIRSGRRDVHGSPHHTKWMWSTRSDNSLLVNGVGQYAHTPLAKGRITALVSSPHYGIVAGEAGGSYKDLHAWSRRILFVKPNYVVIHDVIEAKEPSTFQWLLHTDETPLQIHHGNHLTWEGEPGAVDVRFLQPEGLESTQTDEFDPPPAEWAGFKLHQWHLTASTTRKAETETFVVVMALNGATTDYTLENGVLTLPGEISLAVGDDQWTLQGWGEEKTINFE
jgi:hypothetical protein